MLDLLIVEDGGQEGDVKVLLGLMRFGVLGLAETFLKEGGECDSMIGTAGIVMVVSRASEGVAVLVHKSLEYRE